MDSPSAFPSALRSFQQIDKPLGCDKIGKVECKRLQYQLGLAPVLACFLLLITQ